MPLSIKSLGVRKDVVTCFTISEAPDPLKAINLNGEGTLIWVVPSGLEGMVSINSLFSEHIRGAKVYVS